MTTRSFNGQLHIRLSPKLHEQLAKESFSTGQTMNQLCVEAISMKWVLEKDPKWKKLFKNLLAESKTHRNTCQDMADPVFPFTEIRR